MARVIIPTVTANNAVRASWGNIVKGNDEDHETRVLLIEKLRTAEVAITSPQLLALRATPKQLVAAPGAGLIVQLVSILLLLDATATAYVESVANLAVRYTGTTGAKASDDIEATGFIDQIVDTMTTGRPKLDAIVAKAGCENQGLFLHNLGAAEYTIGTGTLRVKCDYVVRTTGW